jgi:hypothetical protein
LFRKLPLILALAVALPTISLANERSFTISGGQVTVPVGLTVQVKSITVGEDATKVRLLASFDSHRTNSVNMNDSENAYLAWGEGEESRLHLRQIADNKWMRISNGQTMEGDLVFPGVIPANVEKVSLVFNPGKDGSDTVGPGVTIPLELKQ